jgi:hypothetical protein
MAGIPGKGGVKGRSGPAGNMNAFKHGLASIEKRREEGVSTQHEESVRLSFTGVTLKGAR